MHIRLKIQARPILALSGYQKASFCFISGEEAFISDKTWDLRRPEEVSEYRNVIKIFVDNKEKPQVIAHDFHPDFYSSRLAKELSVLLGIPAVPVRHHHAHALTVAGEYNIFDSFFSLALDGFGLGEDGELWGGEFLFIGKNSYKRLGRLRPILQPGGDLGVIRPDLLLASFYYEHKGKNATLIQFRDYPSIFWEGISKGINCHYTSSCGRYFDLACSLLNIRKENQVETLLHFERLAINPKTENQSFKIIDQDDLKNLDLTEMLLSLQDYNEQEGSEIFHGIISEGLTALAIECTKGSGIKNIAIGGGCILNQVLKRELESKLSAAGFKVFSPHFLSAGDDQLSFGMALAVL